MRGGVKIGDNVSIAHGSTILSTSHTFDEMNCPIKYQPIKQQETVIDDDVWIGCGVVVLSGTRIGKGCVIGANSVVTKSINDFSVAVGSPAKILKRRGDISEAKR